MSSNATETNPAMLSAIYTKEGLLHLINALPAAVAVMDSDMTVALANTAVCSMLDKHQDELIGKPWGVAFECANRNDVPEGCGFGPDCSSCRFRQTLLNTMRQGQPYKMVESSMILENLSRMHFRINTLPLQLNEHEGVLVSIEDITRARELESAKMENERLSAAVQTAGAICHEMNQPLMAIMGYSDMLVNDLSSDSGEKDYLLEIKKQAERLGKITAKLMKLTRYRTKRYLNGEILDIDAGSDAEEMKSTKSKEGESI